jgi:hypothetical protein
MKYLAIVLCALFLLGCGGDDVTVSPADAGTTVDAGSDAGKPTPPPVDAGSVCKLDGGLASGTLDQGSTQDLPMTYKGGPVMSAPVNVYFIWYGNWDNTKAISILEQMMLDLDKSAWYQIVTGYYQEVKDPTPDAGVADAAPPDAGDASVPEAGTKSQVYASSRVNLIKSIYVGTPHGTSLSDDDIATIVTEVISSGKLPPDPDGLYFVLTSKEIDEGAGWSGFCSSYCGWHNSASILGVDIKYSFVGDGDKCPDACSLRSIYEKMGIVKSPNDNWSADAMVSVILHELVESVTDPDPISTPAWQDDYGYENGDKCAWTFGDLYQTNNCSIANVPIGSHDFIVQQNWILTKDGGHCGLHP